VKGKWYRNRQVQAAIAGAVVLGLFTIAAALMTRSPLKRDQVDEPPPTPRVLRILNPTDGQEVGLTEVVRAESSYMDRTHYLVVAREGSRWIVGGPMTRALEGELIGNARFGAGDAGIGKQFSLSVVAVKGLLPEGDFPKVPDGSALSRSVTVRRVR